jgi:hypothetical protein
MHQRACKQNLYVPQKTKEFYEQKSCSSMADVHVAATTRKSCPDETKYPP